MAVVLSFNFYTRKQAIIADCCPKATEFRHRSTMSSTEDYPHVAVKCMRIVKVPVNLAKKFLFFPILPLWTRFPCALPHPRRPLLLVVRDVSRSATPCRKTASPPITGHTTSGQGAVPDSAIHLHSIRQADRFARPIRPAPMTRSATSIRQPGRQAALIALRRLLRAARYRQG